MFVYEKRLQYPVRIKQTNPQLAKIIITQYGGAYSKSYNFIKKIRVLSPVIFCLINPQH